MCYRHATVSFDRPCPECGSAQCNLSMYCSECGAELPYVAYPSQCESLDETSAEAPEAEDSFGEKAAAKTRDETEQDTSSQSTSPSRIVF